MYSSWEQAATAAARPYEPKQPVLKLRERASRAIRAATEASETHGKQENETRYAENSGNCYECQGRGHPDETVPAKGNEPSVRARLARSVEVWDTILVTVLHMTEAAPSRKTKAIGNLSVPAMSRPNV